MEPRRLAGLDRLYEEVTPDRTLRRAERAGGVKRVADGTPTRSGGQGKARRGTS
ncbi:MAG: hypothetical protein N3F67_00975 [Acidilobaceae archaeon]|nr:hypothetical protein [Acidilobaceae archaeon]